MADLSDVCTALQALTVQAIYPDGTAQPSVAGVDVLVYEGWPIPQLMDADLAAGKVHVSIYPRPEERNVTRYPRDWQSLTLDAAALEVAISGQTVTFSGAAPGVGHPANVSVVANGLTFAYAVQPTDTLPSIATALASVIAVGIPGTSSSGAVITLPASARLTAARVGLNGTAVRELRRQQRQFQLVVWAPTPDLRTEIAEAIDRLTADTQFLVMPDTFSARLIYKGTSLTDKQEKALLYRRDLYYQVEYATTDTVGATQVTQQKFTVTPTNAPSITINT